ncbi:MAG: hypothetical protein II709_12010, partial [Ruminococcus sp.]|nr:hypothetical protein [Ruminococcus sp.]
MQYLDINMWMVGDILLKADRMSMANSLELRVPFLDKEVFKVASTLPTELRVNKHNTKYAMRKAAVRHMPEATAEKEKLGFPVPTRVWLRDEKFYNVVKKKFEGETAQKFFHTEALVKWLDEHFSGKEDNSRRVWTVYVFLVWYDIYFNESNPAVEKPVNHLDELSALAEARRNRQIDAPGEAIMAAAEEIDEEYDAPNFGIDKSQNKAAKSEAPAEEDNFDDGSLPALIDDLPVDESVFEELIAEESAPGESAEEAVPEEPAAENIAAEEPAVQEPEPEKFVPVENPASEPAPAPEPQEPVGYINIQNPEDNEIYQEPRKPATPQEQVQMAIESIERRSKYLDEPNVISDEAVDDIISQINFYGDDDDFGTDEKTEGE